MTAYVGGSTGFGPPSWTTANRPSSPVNGQLGWNSTLGQLESWNGSAWAAIATAVTAAPAFSAYANAVTTTANNTYTKIAFQVKEFDTNSNFDSTTNYRFTPTVAGYYQINSGVEFSANVNGGVAIVIYKNGSAYKTGSFFPNGNVQPVAVVASLVYCNGSTDYLEIYGYQASGGNLNTIAGIQFSWFNGVLVRSA